MEHVPIWILTAVIEFSLLGLGALAGVLCVVWKSKRRLGHRVQELEQMLSMQSQAIATLPAMETPESPPRDEPADAPEAQPQDDSLAGAEVSAQPEAETTLSSEEAAAALAAVELDTEAAGAPPPLVAAMLEPSASSEQAEVSDVSAETTTEIIDLMAPEASPAENQDADASTAAPEADSTSDLFTEETLDALFASSSEENAAADTADATTAATEQHVAAMLSESATMEKQIDELQEKSAALRQEMEKLQANQALPPEDQHDIPLPSTMMQDLENGLAALQQSRERLHEALQQHAPLLEGNGSDTDTASSDAQKESARREIAQLKTELEIRTADCERMQAEYDALLGEYQRIFEASQ